MNRILLVGAIVLCLAACASSAPEAVPTVAAAQPAASSSHAIPVENEPVANDESELHVIDVPEIAQVAHHAPQEGGNDPNELICKRIKTTGSHRVTRVCMTRAEIDQRRAESQAMLRKAGATPDGFKRESIRIEQ